VDETIQEDLLRLFEPTTPETITGTESLATATPVPQDQVDEVYRAVLSNLGLTDREFHTIVERGMFRTKVQEALASQVVSTGLVAKIQMIQISTEEEALAAKARVDSGEDFASVAREVSIDPGAADTGGDMGWFATGQLATRYGEVVEDEAFGAEIGVPAVIQSNESFYVMQVVERDENGPLPEEVLSVQRNSALVDWLAVRRESSEIQIERSLDPDQIPPDPYFSGQLQP
jgi:hypothetical protein